MNLYSNLSYQSFKDFVIQVDEIEAGWMDITIATKDKKFNYSASYTTDPLNDLLEAAVLILSKQPFHVRGGWFLKDNAIVSHDLEGSAIVWLLNYTNDILTILIWDSFSTDLLEDLCIYNHDRETYEKNELDEVPDVTKDLIFALRGAPFPFAQTLIETFKNLDIKYSDEEYKGHWGYSYSEANFNALTKWLLDNKG